MAAQISALPTPPSRQDPTNFNDRADAFLGALPTFQSQANALSTEVNTRADNVQASHTAVLAATNIVKWVSGTTYANGAVVWSPINGLGYRRTAASGSGTTDPSLDTTNYKQVNGTGDVSTSGNQTIAGIKTFSSTILGNISTANSASGSQFTTASSSTEGSFVARITGMPDVTLFNNASSWGLYSPSGGALVRFNRTDASYTFADNAYFIDSNGQGYSKIPGYSAMPGYPCRAWVNFAGSNGSINGAGNISSVTRTATGTYSISFQFSLPNSGYSVVTSINSSAFIDNISSLTSQSSTGLVIRTAHGTSLYDPNTVLVTVVM